MNGSRAAEVHGPRRKKSARYFMCTKCRYSSDRYFNIRRHEHRIHTVPKRQPRCCEITFESKAHYYVHCEKVHPGKRLNLTSQRKYGICAGSMATESIDDVETSVPNGQCYPQTRYMLRSLMRPSKDIGLAENMLNSVEGSNVRQSLTMNSDEPSGYGTKDFLSTNSFSSSLEASTDKSPPDPDYTTNDEESFSDDSHSDHSNVQQSLTNNSEEPSGYGTKDFSSTNSFSSSLEASINESPPNPDYTTNDEESLSDDSHSDRGKLLRDDKKCNDESRMMINENPVTVFTEPNWHKNFYCNPPCSPKEENACPSGNDLMQSGSSTSDCEERNSSSDRGTNLSKASFDSGVPITSTPSNLPLKKRILRNFALGNRENIEKSPNPVGDRLYRRPIRLEKEIQQISKQCRQSRKERQTLGKKIAASKLFSMYNEAENVPPVVKITYSHEARVLDRKLSKEVTSRHMDFVSSIDFEEFYRI